MKKLIALAALLCAGLIATPAFAAPGTPASMSFVINADGSVARSDSAAKVVHGGTGNYFVELAVNVPRCTFIAGIGSADTTAPGAGTVTVAPGAGNKNVVFVNTYDATGSVTDLPFHLIINCASSTLEPAAAGAVAADGSVTRNLGIGGVDHTGTGTYTVSINISPFSTTCIYPATIGTGGTTVQLPGQVSVSADSDASAFNVYTYDIHGNAADRGFQFFASCPQ
jgi:hypothetical protein